MDVFLKLTNVTGESKDQHGHSGEVDVLAWSWGASNSGSGHVGGGMGSGKVNMQDISLTKYVDRASATIFLKLCNGTHFDEAIITVRKSGGETPLDYLVYKMKHVFITSYQTGGSGGEDRVVETISLNFREIVCDYQEQKTDGSAEGGPVTYGWDVPGNVAVA
jgi:type VI secretion system secreted protein Hcp